MASERWRPPALRARARNIGAARQQRYAPHEPQDSSVSLLHVSLLDWGPSTLARCRGQDVIQGGAAVLFSLSVHAAVCSCALLVPGVEEYVRCGRVSIVLLCSLLA